MDAAAHPLDLSRVTIEDVQFVGTNVQMTWRLEHQGWDARTIEASVSATLSARLGLHAVTVVAADASTAQLSVWASPLERLFHAIGPKEPLTIVKYASTTLDLSDVNLDRQWLGLTRLHPAEGTREAPFTVIMTPWDVGKLLGTVMRRPQLASPGDLRVGTVDVNPGSFPAGVLGHAADEVATHGGVRVAVNGGLLHRWRETASRTT